MTALDVFWETMEAPKKLIDVTFSAGKLLNQIKVMFLARRRSTVLVKHLNKDEISIMR